MSRGFVKEGDQEEIMPIPPRATIPLGVENYVTQIGLELLDKERIALEIERHNLSRENETQYRRESNYINGKLSLLVERIQTAKVIDLKTQPRNEVHFGATVTYQMNPSKKQITFQIVGVDEANIKQKKVSFLSPIAKAMIGHHIGEIIHFQLGDEKRLLTILQINYLK